MLGEWLALTGVSHEVAKLEKIEAPLFSCPESE
jgi:hypothetical protein